MSMYISEKEAANRYGLSVHWFRRMRWAGGGPAFSKIGSRCIYPIESTDAYFAERLQRSTSDVGGRQAA